MNLAIAKLRLLRKASSPPPPTDNFHGYKELLLKVFYASGVGSRDGQAGGR